MWLQSAHMLAHRSGRSYPSLIYVGKQAEAYWLPPTHSNQTTHTRAREERGGRILARATGSAPGGALNAGAGIAAACRPVMPGTTNPGAMPGTIPPGGG